MYTTAVAMGYKDRKRIGLPPGKLFDPATSLDLGTEYLARMFEQSAGEEAQDYRSQNVFFMQFAPALRGFNAGPTNMFSVEDALKQCDIKDPADSFVYACRILNNAPNYDPIPFPVQNGGGGSSGGGPTD